jgi:hypothetical protein
MPDDIIFCDGFDPTVRHAGTLISLICDWQTSDANFKLPFHKQTTTNYRWYVQQTWITQTAF